MDIDDAEHGSRMAGDRQVVSPAVEPSSTALSPALRDELHRRVGRNLILLQSIERAWKTMLKTADVELILDGAVATPSPGHLAQREQIGQRTMGAVLGELFERVLISPPGSDTGIAENGTPSATTLRSRWTIELSPGAPDVIGKLQQDWKALVEERNQLVHHSLDEWVRRCPAEIEQIFVELDGQEQRAREVLKFLTDLVNQTDGSRQAMAAWFNSEPGHQAAELAQIALNVMGRLCEIAHTKGKAEGWTFLDTAKQRLRGGDDAVRLAQMLGQDWLRILLKSAGETFELRSEPTPNGSAGSLRWLYRVRADAPDMLSFTVSVGSPGSGPESVQSEGT